MRFILIEILTSQWIIRTTLADFFINPKMLKWAIFWDLYRHSNIFYLFFFIINFILLFSHIQVPFLQFYRACLRIAIYLVHFICWSLWFIGFIYNRLIQYFCIKIMANFICFNLFMQQKMHPKKYLQQMKISRWANLDDKSSMQGECVKNCIPSIIKVI